MAGLYSAKWMKFVLAIFISLNFLVIIVSQANLEKCDSASWYIENDINKQYNNSVTYSKIASGFGSICYKREIMKEGNFIFAWNKFPDDKYSNMDFYRNGELENVPTPQVNNWSVSYSFHVNQGDTLIWKFWSMSSEKHQYWIAFPPEVIQSSKGNLSDRAPERPEILSGPNEGYNKSLYEFSARSNDPDLDHINYIFFWGDNSTSNIGPLDSGEVAIGSHYWNQAGIYNVRVMATDEHGNNSTLSQGKKIRISWLVKVLQGAFLQSVINTLSPNTTILLEGKDYVGPLNISNITNINIFSNATQSNITSIINCSYSIGLENVTNAIINGLNITGSFNGIYLHNCNFCKISNNSIYFKERGSHILGGHDNIITNNRIKKIVWNNIDICCKGISLEDTTNNTITCNSIEGLQDYDVVYYIKNSTFKEFSVPITADGLINNDECCCHLLSGRLGDCGQCVHIGEDNHRIDCSSALNLRSCE